MDPMANKKIPATRLQTIEAELDQILHTKVISGLDGARALAVILVLIDHFRVFDYFSDEHPKTGSLGVMIFFVLSGFLITSMLLKEYRQTGKISLANFYRRRAYRIFPNFYCCWIITTVVYCVGRDFHWKHAALSFFYLMDYGRALAPENVQPWMHMVISWSLAVEEKFYLLWPLLLLVLLKRPNLIRILVSIILGQWIYRFVMALHFHVSEGYVYSTFDMRADALLVGCLLAIMLENDRVRLLCCGLLRRQCFSLLAPLALVLVVVAPPSNKAAWLVVWSMQPLIIAVMLLQAVYWGAKSWTFMGHATVRLTAQLSYALYLYHPLAGRIVKQLGMRHLGYPALILTFIMAPASYYLVERPFMRMRDRPRSREAAIPPVPSVANAITD
jgi:peptidoglycan/LPS O-acetylase OafA/YrhL